VRDRERERERERERAKDVGTCLCARKRNRVFLQFNFTGASTREAFTSGEGNPLAIAFNSPATLALETSLRSRKVTRNLADLPPEFRLNIIHVVDKRHRSLLLSSSLRQQGETPTLRDYPFLFPLIPLASVSHEG